MKKICSNGFKISNADQKALDHYLLVSPRKWAEDALKGMINKATKTIIKDWLEIYKDLKGGNISADISILIPEIIKMENFQNYNTLSQEKRKPKRKEAANIEIWEGGFDVEDYEYEALGAFYKEPEQTLRDFMDNKIALRKKAFVKENTTILIKDPSITEMPSQDDDLIDLVISKPNYKNRKQKEAKNKNKR